MTKFAAREMIQEAIALGRGSISQLIESWQERHCGLKSSAYDAVANFRFCTVDLVSTLLHLHFNHQHFPPPSFHPTDPD